MSTRGEISVGAVHSLSWVRAHDGSAPLEEITTVRLVDVYKLFVSTRKYYCGLSFYIDVVACFASGVTQSWHSTLKGELGVVANVDGRAITFDLAATKLRAHINVPFGKAGVDVVSVLVLLDGKGLQCCRTLAIHA